MEKTNGTIVDVKTFQHPNFGNVRTVMDKVNDKVLFCGKDVATALGYKDPAQAIRDFCKGVVILTTPSKGGPQRMKFIPESDIYRLVMRSKLPEAEKFQDWVCEEVLPQIRRTGGYIPTHDGEGKPYSDLEIMSLAFQIHERTIAERDRKIAEQDETIRVLEPKATYCDEVLESVNCMTMTQVAKEHGTTHTGLTKMLHEKGVIYLQSGQWMLYADFCNHGLTRNRTHSHHDSMGVVHSHSYLVWTEKGRMFLDGILRRDLSPKWSRRAHLMSRVTSNLKSISKIFYILRIEIFEEI